MLSPPVTPELFSFRIPHFEIDHSELEFEESTSNSRKRKFDGLEKRGNERRNRSFGLSWMQTLSDREFKSAFRISRSSFNKLLGYINIDLERDAIQGLHSSGSIILPVARLAATLRFLAGGSFIDIAGLFGISSGSFFVCDGPIWGTVAAIDNCPFLAIIFPIDDIEKLDAIAAGFSQYSYNHFLPKVVLAIDGWLMRTRKPHKNEVDFIKSYMNRKDSYGLVIMAGCDSRLKFHLFSAQCAGATNDSLAWQLTSVFRAVAGGLLPSDYVIIGDAAFTNSGQVLSPWPGQGLGIYKDSFNYHLSAMRQCIERK